MYILVTTNILYKLNFTLFKTTFTSIVHSFTRIDFKEEAQFFPPGPDNLIKWGKDRKFSIPLSLSQVISPSSYVKEKNRILIF